VRQIWTVPECCLWSTFGAAKIVPNDVPEWTKQLTAKDKDTKRHSYARSTEFGPRVYGSKAHVTRRVAMPTRVQAGSRDTDWGGLRYN
jgi:hypothetical protein